MKFLSLILMTALTAALKPQEKEVAKALFKMYTTRQHQEQKDILQKYYDNKVVFEDPLMKVHGYQSYRVQFHSLIKFFGVIDVNYGELKGSTNEDGSITIPNKQHYEFHRKNFVSKKVLPEKVDLDVLTTIWLNKEGKIVKHVDTWVGTPERQYYSRFVKPVMGELASGFMRLIGW